MTTKPKRSVESCSCGHGIPFHPRGFCEYPMIKNIPRKCNCEGFDLNWYIENHHKFNKFGEIIQ